MSDSPRIALIDSGAGGLSILSAMLESHLEAQYFYFADLMHFPYGELEVAKLNQRLEFVVKRLIKHCNPDIITLACNTASTSCLNLLRERFDCQFIGVVPAVKPAAGLTQSNTIGLIATPATVKRDYTANLISSFASDTKVVLHASAELVALAEAKIQNPELDQAGLKQQLASILSAIIQHDPQQDVLVLACTHFPLLKNEIQECLIEMNRAGIRVVDSGEAIARRAHAIAEKLGFQTVGKQKTASITLLEEEKTLESYSLFLKRLFKDVDVEVSRI